ncbi:MAG: hypothetical protein ACRC2B_02800 [Rubrivivax sp.]
MHHDVIVQLPGREEITLHTADAFPAQEASAWLDREFARLDCVATRPTGKVLFVDKVLAIAEAAGERAFADAGWASSFARATAGALRRPLIRVDVPNTTVGF